MVDQGLSDDEDALSFGNVLGHPIYHVDFMERYPALPQECTVRIFGEQRLDASHTRHQHHACQHSGDKCPYKPGGIIAPPLQCRLASLYYEGGQGAQHERLGNKELARLPEFYHYQQADGYLKKQCEREQPPCSVLPACPPCCVADYH